MVCLSPLDNRFRKAGKQKGPQVTLGALAVYAELLVEPVVTCSLQQLRRTGACKRCETR